VSRAAKSCVDIVTGGRENPARSKRDSSGHETENLEKEPGGDKLEPDPETPSITFGHVVTLTPGPTHVKRAAPVSGTPI
jgi:hypothetical protein